MLKNKTETTNKRIGSLQVVLILLLDNIFTCSQEKSKQLPKVVAIDA